MPGIPAPTACPVMDDPPDGNGTPAIFPYPRLTDGLATMTPAAPPALPAPAAAGPEPEARYAAVTQGSGA